MMTMSTLLFGDSRNEGFVVSFRDLVQLVYCGLERVCDVAYGTQYENEGAR